MANNRLYVVNMETKEYAMIAKHFNGGWILGNKKGFIDLINNTGIEFENTNLMFGTEMDDLFYRECIEKGKNINPTSDWKNDWE